ncbi:MAG TPA: hypothetical protein VN661_05475 [Candidatus Acidoferrales bacterium]|nr:hypothetical protein [Candidatus Acidoferrales bacterium]
MLLAPMGAPGRPVHQSKDAPQHDSAKSGAKKQDGGSAAGDSGQPNYDPFHAAKDVEVGTFYLRKGDPDAAIDRFKEAVRLRPDWGEPRKLLGEAYEKKHDKATALKYYKEYLQVFPNPTDRKKIEKKIAKLSKS